MEYLPKDIEYKFLNTLDDYSLGKMCQTNKKYESI